MPADRIHLIRHGEVHNPGGVLYGRLPEFRLSERGHQMAELAAKDLLEQDRKIGAIYSSPLLRTRESAGHVQQAFSLTPTPDERLIEPFNIFEGRKLSAGHILIRPHLYFHLRKPSQPSWGEPFESIAARMLEAIEDAWQNTQVGDAVLVSHQLPIVMVHRKLAGMKLSHNPKQRRCALSSITSFERQGNAFVEVDYRDPASKLGAIDRGAV
jgi:broad specificity phosphatase PhoE